MFVLLPMLVFCCGGTVIGIPGAWALRLVTLLNQHVKEYKPAADGRLFVTRRGPGGRFVPTLGQPIPSNTYGKAWRDAREAVLTPAQLRSPLAKRPYDLRHAAVSL
jgi:hypothetical protein